MKVKDLIETLQALPQDFDIGFYEKTGGLEPVNKFYSYDDCIIHVKSKTIEFN